MADEIHALLAKIACRLGKIEARFDAMEDQLDDVTTQARQSAEWIRGFVHHIGDKALLVDDIPANNQKQTKQDLHALQVAKERGEVM